MTSAQLALSGRPAILIPVPRGQKQTRIKGWQNDPPPLMHPSAGDNIALRLDHVVDVDLDCPEARLAAQVLLLRSTARFGRPSAGTATHQLYDAPGAAPEAFKDIDGCMLVEIRTGRPQYTLIPPSYLDEQNGKPAEMLRWLEDGEPARVDAVGLRESVRAVATAALLARHWPSTGSRHDVAGLAAGFLAHAKVAEQEVALIIEQAATIAGDPDAADRVRFARDTARKFKDGKRVTGSRKLATALGDAVVARLRDWYLRERRSGAPEDAFIVNEIDLRALTPSVWERVRDANSPPRLFLHGGAPVRIAHIPEHRQHRLPRVVLQSLSHDLLRREVAECASFYVEGGNARQVPPPDVLLKNMLALPPEAIKLELINRIVYAPTIAADGTVQTAPGYQPATGAYYVDSGLAIPNVSVTPTRDELREAVALLRTPIAEFPFVDDASRTHALAFGLLPLVRDLIDGPTPLHLFQKSTAGEGATLLVDVLLYPSVGSDVARMSTVHSDDEWRKQITSTLLYGPAVVLIDNARELTSTQLAKVLTDNIWQSRILGHSRDALLRVECAWGATGINPTLHQEIVRRTVDARLDSGTERPWTRTGFTIPDLRKWSREQRGRLVWAYLTLARSWFASGCPKGERSLGMFEQWAEVVGGILGNAGIEGFLANLEHFYDEADVEGDAIRWFIEQWLLKHRHAPVLLAEVALWALDAESQVVHLMSSTSDGKQRLACSFGVYVAGSCLSKACGFGSRLFESKKRRLAARGAWRRSTRTTRESWTAGSRPEATNGSGT